MVLPNLKPNKNLIKTPSGTVKKRFNIITAAATGDLSKLVSKKQLNGISCTCSLSGGITSKYPSDGNGSIVIK
jgi:hypothetical protein